MTKFLQESSNYSIWIPLLISIYQIVRKKKLPWEIVGLLFISFISDFLSRVIGRVTGSNYWIINIYFLIEIILIGLFFYNTLQKKKWVLIAVISMEIIFIITISLSGINLFKGNLLAIYSIYNIFMCLLIFYQIYQNEDDLFIENSPVFLITCAILVYFSGSLFTWGLSPYVLEANISTYSFVHLSNTLKNLILAVALWKIK